MLGEINHETAVSLTYGNRLLHSFRTYSQTLKCFSLSASASHILKNSNDKASPHHFIQSLETTTADKLIIKSLNSKNQSLKKCIHVIQTRNEMNEEN